MTSRCIVECVKFLSRLLSVLHKRQLLGPRKMGRASKNGLRLVKIPSIALENKKLLSRFDLTPK
jgi:hypothetical protein